MSDIRKQVESILKSHTEMKRQLSVLEYELDAQQRMLDPTVIEDKVFSHPEGEWVSGSRPSNKTADIVVEHIDSQRNAKYHALKNLIYNMRLEVNRLEYSLSLLPQEEAEVIRWFYFEELGWAAITAKTLVSQSTVQRRKRNGFEKLVSHYAVLDKLSVQSDDVRTRAR
ncbi:hypothetical protein LJC63_12935, partial [Ruminococcaceae bacterium OttesenSCG-928-L11]|nr:hypothetical protein [Ruminococcaceae bacterium OttesenSCG-928-L11]